MYGPVIDYDLIPDYTYRLFQQGRFVHVPTIFGDDTNGGTVFTPRNTSTLAASNVFLKDQFPYLTLAQLREINARYPVEGRPQFNGTGRYWRQISDVYGDIRYTCPGLYCSSAFTKYGMPDVWNYLYNVSDPIEQASGLGVPHTIEVHSICQSARTKRSDEPALLTREHQGVQRTRTAVPRLHTILASSTTTSCPSCRATGRASFAPLTQTCIAWRGRQSGRAGRRRGSNASCCRRMPRMLRRSMR